jgi:hypothetical protein
MVRYEFFDLTRTAKAMGVEFRATRAHQFLPVDHRTGLQPAGRGCVVWLDCGNMIFFIRKKGQTYILLARLIPVDVEEQE